MFVIALKMLTSMAGTEPGTSRRKGAVYSYPESAETLRIVDAGFAEPVDDAAREKLDALRSRAPSQATRPQPGPAQLADPAKAQLAPPDVRDEEDALTIDDAPPATPPSAPPKGKRPR